MMNRKATVETTKGTFVIELFEDKAPKTTEKLPSGTGKRKTVPLRAQTE